MTETTKKKALKDLKAVLEKHNMSIGWTCSDCSDLHCVFEAGMEVMIDSEVIYRNYNWDMDFSDL